MGVRHSLLVAAVLSLAGRAGAEGTRDPIAAEALFQEAKVLLKQGAWSEGCSKLEASMALDPSVSVLLKIARCREHEGKLAQAWFLYQQAVGMNLELHRDRPARRKELALYTQRELARLDPTVPRLRILLAERPEGLVVLRDEQPVPLASLGELLPVDPGEHTIVASAKGYQDRTIVFRSEPGQVSEIALSLEPAPVPVVPVASSSSVAHHPELPHNDRRPARPAPWGPRRWSGVGLAAAGGVALGASAFFGLRTRELVHQASPYCDTNYACSEQGIRYINDASKEQTRAFIFLGAGAVLAGTGVFLLISTPTDERSVAARLGPGNVTVEGRW